MVRFLFVVAMALALACGAAQAARLDLDAVNQAQFSEGEPKAVDPMLLKAQILLDRARFSPGLIDGRLSDNFARAVAAFQAANGLPSDGKLTRETWDRLTATFAGPVLTNYEVTARDGRGPFTRRIPARMERMAQLKRLGYRNAREKLAERFHLSEQVLRMLNPRSGFRKADTTLVVPNVGRGDPPAAVASVEVDKASREVRVLDPSGKPLAVYPASIGSEEKPAPSGAAEVRRVVRNPTYHYSPKFAFKGVRSKRPFTIARGPNNPVGSVWIDLSIESYGIHGTPDPGKIGTTFSHGCIRLTNWDAEDLAAMVKPGTKVDFKDETAQDGQSQ
ncbi:MULTISPECIES: L,D-transpeptidase [unclassified Mesorhizobium]|uniref:L,D-transpeptidase n=1 Tax=unclassified Mesorhizobium TaxID=325217 RepID=UPI000FCC56A3|nr:MULTISPECIES: L,D-transpeptidase [unclassified Mesorhizobium]TGP20350.1 L,D-transpeptidase [Mesorhizobium sp. M1D.F.Ca.ET.231.01.1.1]TGP27826.1 L,D-transpeptidase [Mesorhizobium sp. M1D.F.Ca.ET.234.01.1.1]TGS42176.1 L,D-transpeptidase [Mesorhizobium sp. M1D.F.Ca.ET.184.01.1.1]TGS59527.1 L,D-transpeptidase [Mesorhizobium sp. M1D.F.Ca.ET.183.01.1.1]